MFYRHKWLTRQGKLFEPWIAASFKGNFLSSFTKNLGRVDIQIICGNLNEVIESKSLNIKHRISLRLSATLIYGTCLLFNQQIDELYDNSCELFLQTSTKRPFNEVMEMTTSDNSNNTDEYVGGGNEEISCISDRASCGSRESYNRVDHFEDFVNVNNIPRGKHRDTFIGVNALRRSVRKTKRVSSYINIGPVFDSNGSGYNYPGYDTESTVEKPPKKKKRQKRRTYRRTTRKTATRRTKKCMESAIDKEAEQCKELPSPDRLRRDSDNESLMSFTFEWENNEQNHSFQSVGGFNIPHHMDNPSMSKPEEEENLSPCSHTSSFIVSDGSDTQDLNLEDFFSVEGNDRRHSDHIKSFHVLYPKGMDIKNLKIFTGPISNYDELDQSNVDYCSTSDSSSVASLGARDYSLREDFNENGVLSKLLMLWLRKEIVTLPDILNLGSRVTHAAMACGRILSSLINLKHRGYILLIKKENVIENIVKGPIFLRTHRYHL